MNAQEKLALLKVMYGGDDSDDVLNAYLTIAGQEIINRAYPYRKGDEVVPSKYDMLQIEIAIYKLNKRGAEQETSHNENGINRTYENADTPKSMLDQVIPFTASIGVSDENATTE